MPVSRGNVVLRQRLVNQLNAGLWAADGFARRMTLISAPAGYGKTTAAIEWLAGLGPDILWLSLDEEDNDPVRFMSYLVAAFQQADADLGARSLEMLQSPQPPQIEAFITLLINDLSANPSPLVLALDDYHFIQNPMIHKLVSFLLEHQPDHLHQVILTREDPLLPVSRLLSRGQARELRQDDLRFTAAETADFLKRTMGLKLVGEDIKALQRRTEGWVAGLQLAALSMQGHADVHNFIKYFAGSNRYILDYLFEEVFAQQTTEVQEFLMRTSVLNQLTIDLCDYIVGRDDSRRLLESLERANLFILPLDPAREWYRYHRLFRDLLRHRLHINQEGEEAQLHMRACDWYEKHGLQSDAVQHALAAADWERASELALGLSESMMKEGEIVTLVGWFRQFPDDVMHADPNLCLDYIWTLILSGQNELAESLLAHVEENTKDQPQYHGSLTSAQAYLARTSGDIPGTIELSERALKLIPEEDKSTRGILAVNLGIAYWHTGQMKKAEQALGEAQLAARETGNSYALLAALIFLGRVQAVRGNLHQAARIFQQAIKNGKRAPIVGLAHLDLAALHYEWNDLQSCREHVLQGQMINQMSGNVEFLMAGYMFLTRLESAHGNTKAVKEALDKIQELDQSSELPEPNRNRSKAFQVEMALKQDDLLAAQQLVNQLKADVDAHPFYRYIGLAHERLLLAQDRKLEAGGQLRVKSQIADQAGWTYGSIAIRILESIAMESDESGLEVLSEALSQSQPEGYIRVFADHGQILVPNLMEAARRGESPEYIGKILAAIGEQADRETSSAAMVEQLSKREIEVLRLVSAGLSNREIAAKLYLSPGTIKTHVHNICGKLGVTNRTQAVVHASELNII
ncbi:LuxR C-terminal-related transcriptional regulator [Chloroflexota bacterium]